MVSLLSMKYVVIKNGFERPYLFSSLDQHRDVAAMIGGEVISAGFVNHTESGLSCYGSSDSLGVASRPEQDSKLINRFLMSE